MRYLFLLLFLTTNTLAFSKNSISNDIRKLKKMKNKHNKIITNLVYKTSKKYELNPKIILAILKLESNFEQSGMNKYKCDGKKECGDFSIAQINYKTWKKSANLNLDKLKSNNAYAIDKMGWILSDIRKRHPKDKLWFLRYHSRNYLLRIRYLKILERYFAKISYELDYDAIDQLHQLAVMKHGWRRVLAIYRKTPSIPPLIQY